MYLNKGMRAVRVAQALGIKNKKQAQDWTKSYNVKGDISFDEETRGKANGSRKVRPNISSLCKLTGV